MTSLAKAIQQLEQKRDKIDKQLAEIRAVLGRARGETRKPMSAATKKKLSVALRQAWAKKKKGN